MQPPNPSTKHYLPGPALTAASSNQTARLLQPIQVPLPPQFDTGSDGPVSALYVRALIPCFNRPRDLDLLLSDLAGLDWPAGVGLTVLVLDNASDPPLDPANRPGLAVETVRLLQNSGGSGGFNAGLARLLSRPHTQPPSELFWLLDSDVRLDRGAMSALLAALAADPGAVVAGSSLALPGTGEVFECGGFIDRRMGEYTQPRPNPATTAPFPVEYVAACSLMVRRAAVERAGLMPEVFINGDDVEWCLRLAQRTGGRILAVPASIARHPSPDKMRTWDRYYAARNAFAPIQRLGLGGLTRFRRAMREAGRAASQCLVGRDDLAALHLRGLSDALAGHTTGPAPGGTPFRPVRPLSELADAIRAESGARLDHITIESALAENAALMAQLAALGLQPKARSGANNLAAAAAILALGDAGIAIASARARPRDWTPARTVVTVAPQGFSICRAGRWRRIAAAGAALARGLRLATALALRGPGAPPRIPPAPTPEWTRLGTGTRLAPADDLTVIVLGYNRWPALDRTLGSIRADPGLRGARVIVVDNASTDSSADLAEANHPEARVLRLSANAGVAGFNRGAEGAESEFILILDDDAAPAPGVVAAALTLLRSRPDLGAVALHPRHPATGASEWAFAGGACDDWPVMGCANLVRREAWRAVGGYEEAFFLYRNDTDLAMKLAAAGWGVHFDPGWVAWHDSPAAAKKSMRWFELATRNWIWLCRRHGRGLSKLGAVVAGWGWAHRQAGLDARAHWRVVRGTAAGLLRRPPPLPAGLRVDGRALRRLMGLRFGKAQAPSTNSASIDRHSP